MDINFIVIGLLLLSNSKSNDMVRNGELQMVSKNESTITLQHFDKNKTNLTEQNSSLCLNLKSNLGN